MPINLQEEDIQVASHIRCCQEKQLPVTYLGMPLTINRPHIHLFVPLTEKIERKLEGWRGRIISRGGRLQLIISVLSSIPIYYMSCFQLPRWVITRIDTIRSHFLWAKSEGTVRGIHLLNWQTVRNPKRWGGMGLPDLEIQNISLLLRWCGNYTRMLNPSGFSL